MADMNGMKAAIKRRQAANQQPEKQQDSRNPTVDKIQLLCHYLNSLLSKKSLGETVKAARILLRVEREIFFLPFSMCVR